MEVRDIHVPLVTQVDIFDLPVGDPRVRPDQEMGYAACQMAEAGKRGNFRSGNYGAGCGATVGKYAGGDHAMKGGIGSCVLRQGRLMVGAIVAVNAFGDIYNWKTGQKIAGARTDDGRLYGMEDMVSFLRKNEASRIQDAPAAETALNTTIGIVFTNASLSKAELCKMAAMAHDGFARSISPIHTSGDGDSIIALSVTRGGSHHFEVIDAGCDTESTGEIPAGIDTVGTLAAWAVSEAILDGVQNAETAYGYPAMSDLHKTRIFPE